ncbi:hypothetical protein [Bacillus sp. Cs-700]|uniref:hypothetical protein n=1 Tax=Bacillus sp. Cs-700 TaxID=2589818 RepID=UPI00140790FE|nr:hypothetical protein [Bacillus sp. Cs-700]
MSYDGGFEIIGIRGLVKILEEVQWFFKCKNEGYSIVSVSLVRERSFTFEQKKKSIIFGIVVLIGILVSAYEFYQPDRLGQASQVVFEEFENDFKDRVGKDPEDINLTSLEKGDSWIIAFSIGDQSPKTEKIAEYEVTEELTVKESSWYGIQR